MNETVKTEASQRVLYEIIGDDGFASFAYDETQAQDDRSNIRLCRATLGVGRKPDVLPHIAGFDVFSARIVSRLGAHMAQYGQLIPVTDYKTAQVDFYAFAPTVNCPINVEASEPVYFKQLEGSMVDGIPQFREVNGRIMGFKRLHYREFANSAEIYGLGLNSPPIPRLLYGEKLCRELSAMHAVGYYLREWREAMPSTRHVFLTGGFRPIA